MKNINITIEEEVYFKARNLIKKRELSGILNNLLKNFLNVEYTEDTRRLQELEERRNLLNEQLTAVNSELFALQEIQRKIEKEKEEEAIAFAKGWRMNNPLREMLD